MANRSVPPPPAPVRPFTFPPLSRERLAGGVTVLSARHGEMPLVTAAVVVPSAGAERDPAAHGGLASLTVDALETGTRARDADEIAWTLERLGAQLGAEISWDAASLRLTVPRDRLEPALGLLAELVRAPAFPEREVERLRDEALANVLQRRKEPRALANDMAARFIFGRDVPYARSLLGSVTSLGSIDRASIADFYRAHYLPRETALLLVGAVSAGDAFTLGQEFFGDWSAGEGEEPGFEVSAGIEATTVFVVDRPGSVQSEIRIGHLGVHRQHQDYYPLLVMNTVLGGAFTSRLNMSLRERHGFTYGASSAYAFRRHTGPVLIQLAVATEVTAAAVREVLREVDLLREGGVTEEEVSAARDYLVGVLPLQLQTTNQLAARLAEVFVFDLGDDYFQHYRARIAAVGVDEVERVARVHLRPDSFAIVVVGDAATIAPELEQLGVGPIEVHSGGEE